MNISHILRSPTPRKVIGVCSFCTPKRFSCILVFDPKQSNYAQDGKKCTNFLKLVTKFDQAK